MTKEHPHFKKERLGGSLAARVLLICLALLIFPLMLHAFFFYHRNYKDKITDRLREIELIGKSSEVDFSEWLMFYERSIREIASHRTMTHEDMVRFVKHLKLASLFQVVKRAEDQYICVAAADERRVGEVNLFYGLVSQVTGDKPVVFAARDPLLGTNQIFLAMTTKESNIIVLGKSAAGWVERFSQAFREYFSYWLSLVDDTGNVLATNDPYFSPKGAEVFPLKDVEENKLMFLVSKKKFFILDIPFADTNFSLNIGFSKGAIEQEMLKETLTRLGIFFFFAFFIGGGLVSFLTWKMMQPLKTLYNAMRGAGKGDLTKRYQRQKWGFEINKVGVFFNHTVERLIANMKEAAEERLKSETYHKELQIAREIQKSLFPKKIPAFPSIEIATGFLPAKSVSGDFYDLFPLGEKLMIVIADASGKGVSSSLYSLSVRSLLRSAFSEYVSLAETVNSTNELFCLDTQDSGSFVTAWVGLYDTKTKWLEYTSCGHNPLFLRRLDGRVEELVTKGMALGVSPTQKATTQGVQLEVGDCILLYTDGLVEAENRKNEFYGKQRVLDIINNPERPPVADFLALLLKDLSEFTQGADQFDDITLIALQIVPT